MIIDTGHPIKHIVHGSLLGKLWYACTSSMIEVVWYKIVTQAPRNIVGGWINDN